MEKECSFTARIQVLNRIAIPNVIVETLDVQKGDIVEVKVKKVRRRK